MWSDIGVRNLSALRFLCSNESVRFYMHMHFFQHVLQIEEKVTSPSRGAVAATSGTTVAGIVRHCMAVLIGAFICVNICKAPNALYGSLCSLSKTQNAFNSCCKGFMQRFLHCQTSNNGRLWLVLEVTRNKQSFLDRERERNGREERQGGKSDSRLVCYPALGKGIYR